MFVNIHVFLQPFIIPIANPIAALPVNGIPRFVIVVVGNIIGGVTSTAT